MTVSVEVENIGKRAGDEVVQLYTHQVKSSVTQPLKQLRGFDRVSLQPKEKKAVSIILAANQLAFYDLKTHNFIVEPGAFDILVGSPRAISAPRAAWRLWRPEASDLSSCNSHEAFCHYHRDRPG